MSGNDSTIARNFSQELMDIFRIDKDITDLDDQVDKRSVSANANAGSANATIDIDLDTRFAYFYKPLLAPIR